MTLDTLLLYIYSCFALLYLVVVVVSAQIIKIYGVIIVMRAIAKRRHSAVHTSSQLGTHSCSIIMRCITTVKTQNHHHPRPLRYITAAVVAH